MLTPSINQQSPVAVDPRSRWLTVSEQLMLLFARLGVDPETQPSVLHDSVDTDALNELARTPTATVSFALWGYWVRITPDVIEVYAPADVTASDTGIEEPRT